MISERKKALLEKKKYEMNDLLEILEILRSPEGCDWDREQTHESIRDNMLEEAYEAVENIDSGNADKLCDELGDVLQQVVFHSQIAKEAGEFCFDDVTDMHCKKLIYRHPHVFGNEAAKGSGEVLDLWNKMKKSETGESVSDSLRRLPKSFPALFLADKIGSKCRRCGFDFNEADDAFQKVKEEVLEVEEEINTKGEHLEEEIGDLLLAVVNTSRLFGINAETALKRSCEKYIKRFSYVESVAASQGRDLKKMSEEEKNELWNASKA